MKENNPRIKLYIACSLDGYIARKDGSIDWLIEYENNSETDYGYSEFYASIGTVLMGRKTYEQVLGFGDWPYGEKKTYVFTRQKEPLHREKNVEFVSEDVGEFVRRLKENTDEDIWLVGGSQLIKVFLEEDLVDDMIVFVVPIILGSGISLFDRIGKEFRLKIVDTERYESGLVKLKYEIEG
ncbi:Dihydrofolate reductase [Methanosarcina horonobensis HB-1 = JCM 15518]|uniref:Dihydrofolate reductase n=1 Tax=Methanosarcina horonobensis HB-1 = JCM 15518 TaxID=1434110 RepID=A0A0E3SA87_9EURY|nr:dihydrofolate reductase family protein [Methanosarcina horonobensis]AKB76572.1 Dihydrofolate reductase [Methanosarcina horonobensis HB-1 = JCM 15518]